MRELKNRLSECLRRMLDGELLQITARGQRIARALPERASAGECGAQPLVTLDAQPWLVAPTRAGKPKGATGPLTWLRRATPLSETIVAERA